MVNRDSLGYKVGRFLGRVTLIVIRYIIRKKYSQKPIDQGFPEKKL